MTIVKRLKNLWKLSEYEPATREIENNQKVGDRFSMIYKPKMATIVDLSEEVDIND